ncbi:splicing regulator RBM11 isoform X1 [Sarcophilus harrisii]|uniref:Splicing regulator RBM11 n=1 Tax=Sarcophilus harrisii TaxID=9305 RepID=A0A7N4NUJ5_SARHA|nr:splicing regulator RBM11 isoform X1 [Sarcophilus harrisii]
MSDTWERTADRTVFVGNLETRVREEILYELFLQAGPLTRVTICKDKEGKPKPFGFVCFKHQESVSYAIALLNGIRLYGRPINVQYRFGSSHSAELNNQVAENYVNINSQIYRNEDYLSRAFPIQTFTANDVNFTQEFGSHNMQHPIYNLMAQPSKCQMTPPLTSSFSLLSMLNPLSDLDARSSSFEFVHQPTDWDFYLMNKRKWQPETSDSSTEDDIGKVRECNQKYRRYKKRKRN